eukprot:1592637-Alexandrium_andersonii.AAC.1
MTKDGLINNLVTIAKTGKKAPFIDLAIDRVRVVSKKSGDEQYSYLEKESSEHSELIGSAIVLRA